MMFYLEWQRKNSQIKLQKGASSITEVINGVNIMHDEYIPARISRMIDQAFIFGWVCGSVTTTITAILAYHFFIN